MVGIKTIKIGQELLDLIEKKRTHHRETYDEILMRLLKLNSNKMKGGKK